MNSKSKRVGFFNRTFAIVAAVLIHAVLIFFLVANFNKPREAAVAKDADEIDTIIATTVSADEIKNQKKKIQKADDDRKKKAEERRKKEQRELEKLKKEKEVAKKELEEAKQKRVEEEKAIALKRKKEKERKEKEKKKKEAEKKRKAEEQRKKKKAEAAKKKKEAEEAEKQRKQDRLKSLQDELSKELSDESRDEKIAAQPTGARNTTTLFNKYVALIGDKVKANFNAPLGTPVGMEAVVNVRLDSVGRVQSTKIVKSSGNFAFDRAVEVAVARSAPLPMPPESDPANARLQNINFPFRYRGS